MHSSQTELHVDMASRAGLEPTPTAPKAVVLPLNYLEVYKKNRNHFKQIFAGDEICPRAFFQDNEHFIPHMQILWVTNHIPLNKN